MLRGRTKKARTRPRVPMRRWRRAAPRRMWSRKPMIKDAWQRKCAPLGLSRSPLRSGNPTFLNDCSEPNGRRQRLPRRLSDAGLRSEQAISQAMINNGFTPIPLLIADSFQIYVRKGPKNFRYYVPQDGKQDRHERGETRAAGGAAREWPPRRIQRRT